ncbi:MAG: hypothetical protein AAFY76_26415 [Cyanobacteria bacterium J06649_11]
MAVALNWRLAAWWSVFLRSVASVVAQAAGLLLSFLDKESKQRNQVKTIASSGRFDGPALLDVES